MKHDNKLAILAGSTALAMPRAIIGQSIRADVNDPKAMIQQVNAAFEEFKKINDEKLKAKADDAVTTEKLNKIDAALGNYQTIIDDLNAKLAASAGVGVIGDIKGDPEYVDSFKAHMRKGAIEASLNKGADAEGGYLAPVEWDRTITGRVKEISPMRTHARVITISTAGFKKIFTDRAIGSGWVGEKAARPETGTPGFVPLTFDTGEIYANPAATQQMLDDAALDLEAWLGSEVRTEFSRQENIAFISGSGVNKPYGLLLHVTGAALAARHPWGAIEAKPSGDAAGLDTDGLIDLVYALPTEYRGNAKFFMNRLVQGATRKLKDGQGNYIWSPSFALGQPSTLLGEAIVDVPDMPDIAPNAIAALYGDMDETYLIVDRVGIRVLRDPYTNKPYVMFYTTKRVGGGVQNPTSMKALKIAAA